MQALGTQSIFGIPYAVAPLAEAGAYLAGVAADTQGAVLVAHSDVHVLTDRKSVV